MRRFLARQWVRFQAAAQFLAVINYGLLVYSVARNTGWGPYLVAGGLTCVWLCGWLLLDFAKFPAAAEDEGVIRSPAWQRLFAELREIKGRLP